MSQPIPREHYTSTPPTHGPDRVTGVHTWVGVPVLAIEFNAHRSGDLIAHNPYSGATVTLFDAYQDEQGALVPLPEMMRQLGQAIEQVTKEGGWHHPELRALLED